MICEYGHKVEPNPQGCAHCSRLRLQYLSGPRDLSPDEIDEWAALEFATKSPSWKRSVAEIDMW